MSYSVRPSLKNRRVREREDYGSDRRAKPKNKQQRIREIPEEREPQPRKVVVRNLPANFTKELFLQHVSPLPDYTYLAFHGPDATLANHARCRVYLRFRSDEDVGIFKEKFDGYVFVDGRGHELRCIVEMAPYQRTAEQNREKLDAKCGLITESEEYKKFIDDIEKKKENVISSSAARVQASLAALENKGKEEPGLTPLMEYLQSHKAEDDYRRSVGGRFGGSARKERFRDRIDRNARRNIQPPMPPKKDVPSVDKTTVKEKELNSMQKDAGPLKSTVETKQPVRVMELSRPVTNTASPEGVRECSNTSTKPVPARPPPISERLKKDDFTPPLPVYSQKSIDRLQPSSDRGRHFFSNRPGARGTSDKRGVEVRNAPFQDSARQRDQESENRPGDLARQNDPPTRAPVRNERPEGHADRERPSETNPAKVVMNRPENAVDRPRPDSVSNSKPMVNPITGSREFAQSKPAENIPTPTTAVTHIVEKVTVVRKGDGDGQDGATGSHPEVSVEGGDSGPRVPNRARPSMQLYQPKAKRRYQN